MNYEYTWDVEGALEEKNKEVERLNEQLDKAQAEIRRLRRVIQEMSEEIQAAEPNMVNSDGE